MTANNPNYGTLQVIGSGWTGLNSLQRLFVLYADLYLTAELQYEPSISAETLTVPYQMMILSSLAPIM
jgi:hypothetical protein